MEQNTNTNVDFKRANKLTTYWEGEGVAVGVFYKTHEKLAVVRTSDDIVVNAGYALPNGTAEAPVTAGEKLESFKQWLASNSSLAGVVYDPVDRRDDKFKFPGKYQEDNFSEFADKMLKMSLEEVLTSVQTNVIDKMVKAGNMPEGSQIQYGVGEPTISVSEKYNNGNLKYATATFPTILQVGEKQLTVNAEVDLVSGQLKKPRHFADVAMTMTGIKGLLVDNELLPKIEKPKKDEESAETDETPIDNA